jgi:hypothetical protein
VAIESEVRRPSEVRLRDPLSDVTRTERRNLLGVSAIGIVIAKSGLVPSKITALGIECGPSDQRALLKMFTAIVLYFLLAFVIYAISDLVAWRTSFHQAVFEWRKRRELLKDDERSAEDRMFREFLSRGQLWSRVTRPVSLLRAIFDFAVPVLIAAYAVHALSTTPPPKPANPPKSATISLLRPSFHLGELSVPDHVALMRYGSGGELRYTSDGILWFA